MRCGRMGPQATDRWQVSESYGVGELGRGREVAVQTRPWEKSQRRQGLPSGSGGEVHVRHRVRP